MMFSKLFTDAPCRGWRWVAALAVGGSLLLARSVIRVANDTIDARLDESDVRPSPRDGTARAGLHFIPDRLFVDLDLAHPDKAQQVALHLANRSTAPVRLLHITASCGCTLVDAPAQGILGTGEEMDLTVRVHVPALGEKVSLVEAHTDAARSPVARARLVLRGETPSAPYVSTVPRGISLSGVTGEFLTHEIVVAAVEKIASPNWLTSLAADADDIEVIAGGVSQQAGPTPGTCVRTYRYELRTTGPARAQRIDFQLTLHTAAAKPIAFIPVSLDVRPLISAMPSSVYVKVNSSNEFPIDRVINVRDDRSGNGRELQLQKPADDFLKVTVERLSDGGQFSMRLRLRIDGPPNDPAQNRGVRKTALTLCTDMPENERLVIPVVVEYR